MVKLIVAVDKNGAIGKENKLLYKIDEDLQNFKNLTTNNTIIMGRKTWESLPKKPLPNRKNIVITKNNTIENIDVLHSMDELENYINMNKNEDIYIIGGSSIYDKCLDLDFVDEIHITHIDDIANVADAFFDLDKVYRNFTKKEKKNTFSQGDIKAEYIVYRR